MIQKEFQKKDKLFLSIWVEIRITIIIIRWSKSIYFLNFTIDLKKMENEHSSSAMGMSHSSG